MALGPGNPTRLPGPKALGGLPSTPAASYCMAKKYLRLTVKTVDRPRDATGFGVLPRRCYRARKPVTSADDPSAAVVPCPLTSRPAPRGLIAP